MPALNAVVSFGCNTDGTGWLQVDSVGSPNSESIQVNFSSPFGGYMANFPPDSTPYRISPVATETEYEVTVNGSVSGAGTVKVQGVTSGFVPVGFFELSCFACDVMLPSVATTHATDGLPNGQATISGAGRSGYPLEYSIDGQNWQASNVFNGLAIGNYTAWVRYVTVDWCQATKAFTITAPPVYGCTNPEADNYNPEATEDNGTCQFFPRYYPTGGTLPNPVYFEQEFAQYVGAGVGTLKSRHYVTVNLYHPGDAAPFASKIGRVKNGYAKIDIAKELQIGQLAIQIGGAVSHADSDALFPFEIGYRESYNGTTQPEVRRSQPKRYAVRAALAGFSDSVMPFVVKDENEGIPKFFSAFDAPVMFHGEPVCLAILIDESAYAGARLLYLQRDYFDAMGRTIYRTNSPVTETGYVRFEIADSLLPCVAYGEIYLTDSPQVQDAECIDATAPIPPGGGSGSGGSVTIKDGSGNTIATVPAGGTFVIESGFSFGFRIL